jgi:hypothetical protein
VPLVAGTDIRSRRYIAEETITFRDMPRVPDAELAETAAHPRRVAGQQPKLDVPAAPKKAGRRGAFGIGGAPVGGAIAPDVGLERRRVEVADEDLGSPAFYAADQAHISSRKASLRSISG